MKHARLTAQSLMCCHKGSQVIHAYSLPPAKPYIYARSDQQSACMHKGPKAQDQETQLIGLHHKSHHLGSHSLQDSHMLIRSLTAGCIRLPHILHALTSPNLLVCCICHQGKPRQCPRQARALCVAPCLKSRVSLIGTNGYIESMYARSLQLFLMFTEGHWVNEPHVWG